MAKAARHTSSVLGGLAALLMGSTALAQSPAQLRVEALDDGARLIIDYPDTMAASRPNADVSVEHTVLIAALSEPIAAEVRDLPAQLGGLAARARLDPDGRTLRIALNRSLDVFTSSSYDQIAIDILPAGSDAPPAFISPMEQAERDAAARAAQLAAQESAPPPPVDPVPVEYRVGQAAEYTRIELTWPEPVTYAVSQDEEIAEVRFSRPAEISLNRLAGSPPRHLENIEAERDGDEWILRLTVDPGITVRAWSDGNKVSIDLTDPDVASVAAALEQLAALAPEETGDEADISAADMPMTPDRAPDPAQSEAETAPSLRVAAAEPAISTPEPEPVVAMGDPVPESGVISVTASPFNGDLRLNFPFEAPVGASVFRRGEAIWVVFDVPAELDMGTLGYAQHRHVRAFETFEGPDYTALRIVAPETTQAGARTEGEGWNIVLSERIDSPARPINVRRDAPRGRPGRFLLTMSNPSSVRWLDDPVVGDRIGLVTAYGPVEGLSARRSFVGGAILPSAQGAAIQTMLDDLTITITGSGATISQPGGLVMTPSARAGGASGSSVLANIASPALMDFESWKGDGYFSDEWSARLRRAAMEDGPDGQIGLARFLIANDLAPEALGILDLAVQGQPELANDSHIRALAGVASYMMRRLEDAEGYFADPSLALDPAAEMWRGMVLAEQEKWEDARRRLQAGEDAAFFYTPAWQARYQSALARVTMELGDFGAAQNHLYAIEAGEPDEETRLDALYVSARLAEASGDIDSAITVLEDLSRSNNPPAEAQALHELYRLQLEAGRITRDEAIDNLENLRFRWRGDTIESDTIRSLGQLYVESGDYARGLETMATAQMRFAGSEAERRIAADMDAVYRRLFLEGEADNMDPIEAVAIFYQYQYLAPVGADGDRMIRRLADRLIAFDLLDPAAELLQHQVENRLREPLARARVATDLAIIYLMDRRYEDALNTIRRSRVAGLPDEIVDERYLLEARALAELGRAEAALDLVEGDQSLAAARLRADVAWEQREWTAAGRRLEQLLGNRYTDDAPLSPAEESDLMRAAIAYSLSGDSFSASRLGDRYGDAMGRTDQAAAFAVLTDDTATPGDVRFSDLAGRIAGIDTLESFIEPFRERFTGGGA